MSNIGFATLSVIPSALGFGSTLTKGIAPEMAAAGQASGLSFSKGLVLGVSGVVAMGAASLKMAADFQSATTLLVTGAGESEKSIGLVRDGLLAMAPAVGIGPTALAKAMFMVESAGFHGAAGLLVMKAAAEGAKIGGADATVVANGLTTALVDYHLPASMAAEVTSKLVATVAAGKTTMQDLSAALSTILPFSSAFGVSLNDVAGAMATMTGEGINAATSATMLKFTMSSMANETPKGQKALASIGLTAQQLKNDLSSQGVGGALQTVTDMIGKKFPAGSVQATAALAAIVGGTRGMGTALALTNTHAATLIANIKSIAGASTEAGGHVHGWALTQTDLNFQIDRARAWISALAIQLGTKLIPYVTTGISKLSDFAGQFSNGTGAGGKFRDVLVDVLTKTQGFFNYLKANPGTLDALEVSLGTLAVAYTGVKVAAFAAAGAQGMAALLNPIGLTIAGIALLAGAFTYSQGSIGIALAKTQIAVLDWTQVMITGFHFVFDSWTSILGGMVHAAALIAPFIAPALVPGLDRADQAFSGFRANTDKTLSGMSNDVARLGNQAQQNLADAITAKKVLTDAAAARVAQGIKDKLIINSYGYGVVVPTGMATGMDGHAPVSAAAAARIKAGIANQLYFNTVPLGQSIGSGLVTGMNSYMRPVITAAENLAGSANAAMAAKLAHPKSPSPVYVYFGKTIGQGLVAGMDSTRGAVAASASALLSMPRPGSLDFASPAQRSSAAGAGGGATGADIKALGDRIAVELANQARTIQTMQRQMAGAG